MNDDKDMPLNPVGDDALEARIVAWVLGEASSFEAEELERLCAADPALRLFERRMRVLHGLIAEDMKIGTDADWKLPEGKRSKITDLLGVDPVAVVDEVQQGRTADRSGRRLLLALAACAVISLVAWSMMATIGGVGEKAVVFSASKESVDFLPGGAAGGSPMAEDRASSVPQKKSMWNSAKSLAPAASSDVQASVMLESDAESFALADAPAEPMNRAQQESKEVAELQSLAANQRQSPSVLPPPSAMPAQRPAVAEKAEGESELLAKRQKELGDFDRAPAGPEVATRFRGDLDGGVPTAGKPVTDIVTAGGRGGDDAIARNNIDAILVDPNRVTGTASGGAVLGRSEPGEAGDRFAWSMTGEGVSDGLASAADGFASAAADANLPMGGVSGALKDGIEKDLKLSEARSKSEVFAFDRLGELAQELPADQSRFGAEFQLGGFLSPGQKDRADVEAYVGQSLRFYSELDQKSAAGVEVTREYRYSDREMPQQQGAADGTTALGLEGAKQFFGEDSLQREANGGAVSDPFASAATPLKPGEPAVDEVRRSLSTADGHYNLGKYDDAYAAYEEALRIDPYNKAARRGMEQVAQARSDYYRAAYDQTRAQLLTEADYSGDASGPPLADQKAATSALPRADFDQTRAQLLAEVDKAWELSVPPLAEADNQTTGLASMVDKRKSIIVPDIDLKNATVGEAVDLLQMRAVELDVKELDPAKKGIKFSLEKPAEGTDQADLAALRIPELKLENVALGDAIKQVADAAGLEYAYNEAGVILKPGENTPKKSAVTLDAMAEIATAAEPFSTFSLHVSDASFKLAKAAMDRGEIPAADGIRPEEFYNAFDYGDPSPANGEPVVCAVEQSAHPAFPQRNLLRIGVKTGSQGRGQSTPLNLTLLLDSSGSMEREDRNAGLANAVQQLSGLLKEGDTITVAGFSRQPRLLADRLPGARAQELNGLIAQTPSEGGTNLEEGLKLGEELAKRQFNPAAQNRVVLFTDGAANLGDARPEALQAKVEELRQQGIAFDAAGFGAEGLNDKLLERLTRNGNGRYYIVDRAEDADANFAKQLAGAFRPAAENVKVQVRFNPARVAKYKLIGFEEHRLKKEDFRDDAVDAAEMAAEEAGNALYQIEVLPQGEGEVGEVSVRFRDVASGQMVERTWTIPYDPQAPAFDQAKPAIQLAGLAAFAAEKLRGAPMADAIDLQQLAPVTAKVKARYANSQPVADLESMLGKLK